MKLPEFPVKGHFSDRKMEAKQVVLSGTAQRVTGRAKICAPITSLQTVLFSQRSMQSYFKHLYCIHELTGAPQTLKSGSVVDYKDTSWQLLKHSLTYLYGSGHSRINENLGTILLKPFLCNSQTLKITHFYLFFFFKSTFLQIRQIEREKHFIWQRRSRMFSTFIHTSGSQGKSRFMNKENCSYGQLIYCFNSLQSDCCDPHVF